MNMRFAAAIVAIVLAAVAGCGTPVPEVAIEEMVSYTAHLEPLVIAHCLSCHESGEAKAKLVLDPGVGYERLVGQRSIQDPEMALVEPERARVCPGPRPVRRSCANQSSSSIGDGSKAGRNLEGFESGIRN
jgi:hypothetical protein